MDKRMVEEQCEDAAAQFHKSLKELRDFSSQLYHAADYCKTAFLSSQNKTQILETTKDYVSQAVVVVVDHIGTISSNLESCISKSNSVSETERRLDKLKQRIGSCQIYSYRISMPRLQWGSDFSRYHSRYVSPPADSKDSTVSSHVSRYSRSCIDAKHEEAAPSEAVELLRLSSSRNYENLRPVEDDGLLILPKTKNSVFQLQEAVKVKRGTINWKAMMQSKDVAALIRRGKRLLA